MSKKVAIMLSIICFAILVVLVVCEKKYPTAGVELLRGLMGK